MVTQADRWLRHFSDDHHAYAAAATLAQQLVQEAFQGLPVAINAVEARAKSPSSAAEKIVRKGYKNPALQMTDLIGVRVMTTYAHGVDDAEARLRQLYEVIEGDDKRGNLALHEFGYRSVHLVIRIGKTRVPGEIGEFLEDLPVEVQIRSVLEHAWAEIEHDLRYKGGQTLTDVLNRRFSAMAGALEVLDREFDRLYQELYQLVDRYSADYAQGIGPDVGLDGPRLIAVLAVDRPLADPLGPRGKPLSLPVAARAVSNLATAGVTLDNEFRTTLRDGSLLGAIREYAYAKEVDPSRVSALAVVDLIVAYRRDRDGIEGASMDPDVDAAVASAVSAQGDD